MSTGFEWWQQLVTLVVTSVMGVYLEYLRRRLGLTNGRGRKAFGSDKRNGNGQPSITDDDDDDAVKSSG